VLLSSNATPRPDPNGGVDAIQRPGYARGVRSLLAAAAVVLAVTSAASAEVVAPGVTDGLLTVGPSTRPFVGYVRGNELVIAHRVAKNRWQRRSVLRFAKGSRLAAFAAGVQGPVGVVVGPTARTVYVVRMISGRWTKTLVGSLPVGVVVGWPGLALTRTGLPVVAYARWHQRTEFSHLVLARISADGRVHSQRVTAGGWPKSHLAPPAVPIVLPDGRVHVLETYGISGAVGTIEWIPVAKTWKGQFISAGVGDFPVGPMFAVLGRGSLVYAAWTEAFIGSGEFPVTLASHGRSIDANVVLDRALTTGLVLTPNGPEVAANEWVSGDEFAVPGANVVWAGTLTGHGGSELDGAIDGLASVPGTTSQDFLLAGPRGLSWFRTGGALPVHVSLAGSLRTDGSIALTGRVHGARSGRVTIYRERSATARDLVGTVRLARDGSFTLLDPGRTRPALYRAVYTDPATGIPYAKLLREPIG
jgi:hypothetical protein